MARRSLMQAQLRGVVMGGACCEVSLSYDCYEGSSMAELLLSRAAYSPRIAHHLFWSAHPLAALRLSAYA